MVRTALADNAWLKSEGVSISPQGSYFNNTNVRLESDMDLRAVHPLVRIVTQMMLSSRVPKRITEFLKAGAISRMSLQI